MDDQRRLRALSDRLSGLRPGNGFGDEQRGADVMFGPSNSRLQLLEGRIERQAAEDGHRVAAMLEQLATMEKEVRGAVAAAEGAAGPRGKAPQGTDVTIFERIDDVCAELRLDIARERRLRDEAEEDLARLVCTDVGNLAAAVTAERARREEQHSALQAQIRSIAQELDDIVAAERAAREAAHVELLTMMTNLNSEMRDALAAEREERVAVEAELVEMRSRADRLRG